MRCLSLNICLMLYSWAQNSGNVRFRGILMMYVSGEVPSSWPLGARYVWVHVKCFASLARKKKKRCCFSLGKEEVFCSQTLFSCGKFVRTVESKHVEVSSASPRGRSWTLHKQNDGSRPPLVICLSVHRPTPSSFQPSIYPSVCPSAHLYTHLLIYPSVPSSTYPPPHLFSI